MVISLSMSFRKYPTINLSWVHLQQGSNSLFKWRKLQHCLCYVVNDRIMLKLWTSHTYEVEEIWNANSCKSSLCNLMPEKKSRNNTFLWTQCLYHINGLRIRLLNYLRGLNDPIMIRIRSKPLQHHFCKNNQDKQLSIHTLKYPKQCCHNDIMRHLLYKKTTTPTKPIANNLFAYILNQLDLTNHLIYTTIFWIFTPIDTVTSNQ
jgi:hypothetical protein